MRKSGPDFRIPRARSEKRLFPFGPAQIGRHPPPTPVRPDQAIPLIFGQKIKLYHKYE
jgi:hypothetical protein